MTPSRSCVLRRSSVASLRGVARRVPRSDARDLGVLTQWRACGLSRKMGDEDAFNYDIEV